MEQGWMNPPTQTQVTSSGTRSGIDYVAYALAIDFLAAFFLGFCIWWDVGSTMVAALAGTGFFAFMGWWVVGNRSGLFAATTMNRDNNRTQVRIEELKYLQVARTAEVPQLPYTPPVAAPNYVPAIEETTVTTRGLATTWMMQLFDEQSGKTNSKVQGPRRNIGVKKPSEQVLRYLEGLDMVVRDEGGNLYLLPHYQDWEQVYKSITTGVRHPPIRGGQPHGEGG
jgi:hypothetical protein